jgi:hypothetical protein
LVDPVASFTQYPLSEGDNYSSKSKLAGLMMADAHGLSAGAISLMLVHGDRGHSAAASDAAMTLVRHHLKE